MKLSQERTNTIVSYILENRCTAGQAANALYLSYSTVYRAIHNHLPEGETKNAVLAILAENRVKGAQRGGQATKQKWREERYETIRRRARH